MESLPPLHIVVQDALAMGYEVVVLVVDPQKEDMVWCANTQKWNEDITLESIRSKKWSEAMEEIHGGKISSIEEIEIEEAFYSGEIHKGIWNKDESEEEEEDLDKPHDTWFDPAYPDALADAPCYCGWMGLDQPPAEYGPPGCSCVENIDPNHGHDLGYITFVEKQLQS